MARKRDFDPRYYSTSRISDLEFSIEGLSLPEIDVSNVTDLMERIKLYLKRCDEEYQEPAIAGMCVWLGITTERWKGWVDGLEFGTTHRKICERINTLIESRIECRMLQGQINPVTAMFLLKSQFNYVDTPRPKKAQKKDIVQEMPISDILKLLSK